MLARLDNGYAAEFGSRMDRLLAGLSGRRGIDEATLGARVGAEERALTPMAMFSEARYMLFKKIRARRGDTLEGANAYIRDRLWDALAKTSTKNWRDEAALREELAAGHEFPGTRKGEDHGAFDALEADEIEDALALRELIDHVMNPEAGGLLGRSGLTVDDINDKLSARASEAEKDFLLDGDNVHSNTVAWRVWQGLEDPLTMLDKVHASIRLAQVPADLGRQFSALFSSKYAPDVQGWSDARFRQAGWKKIDADAAPTNSIMRFMVDKDVWYPPEALSQIRYLDGYLNAARSPNPGTAFGKLVLAMDPPLHALKSLATIWRPAHHINNVMGEMAMLAIAGVSPLQTVRSFRALRAAAGLGPDDINALRDGLRRHGFGYGLKLDPKYESDVLTVRLRNPDGSTRFEQIPIAEAMKRWKTDGVALTHTAARDLIEDTVSRSGSRARYLGRRVDKIEEPIGKVSAVRDNLTRIAHAIDAMEKGTFSSIDEAFAATAGRVHDYHPTIRTTGATEQLVARRVFMFYTWMRQAASRIIRTALDRPGLVTIPSKFQYNMAEAYGLNPESIGGPTTDDPRQASYTENSLLGPTLIGRPGLVDGLMRSMGWMPDEAAPGTAGQDEAQDLWQYSLSTPHIDTLQTLFGGLTAAPELGPLGGAQAAFGGQGEAVGDMLNPLITAPYALIFSDGGYSGQVGKNEQALGEFGAISAIGKMLPDPQGKDENFLAAAARGLAGEERAKPIEGEDREKAFEDRAKNIVNFFTGSKLLNTTSPSYASVAKTEWRKRTKRELQNIGVTDPDEVDVILEELWAREQSKLRG
jgi:hypothetical protein